MNTSESRLSQNGRRRAIAMSKWGALIGGGTLAAFGLIRRSKPGIAMAAAGGLLAYAGARSRSARRPSTAHATIILNTSPEQAYNFWRNFEQMSAYMPQLISVTQLGDRTYRFIARGPAGGHIRWDAEITSDRKNERITWQSLPGSDVFVTGSVEFHRASGDRGTQVSATIEHSPALGGIPSAARFLNRTGSFLLRQNMRRAKAVIETGEIPTTEGQTHGPRSHVTGVMRSLNPTKPPRGEFRVSELIEARRSVS